jgi:two-component system nitrogen regulation response regulator NtrX
VTPHSILIVDDEPGIRESLTDVLQDEGYHVESVESGEACLEILAQKDFDVVLLDIWLPGLDGIQVLEKIQESGTPPKVIMISGHGTIETAVRSTKLGAFDFIEKPLSIEKTLLTLRHALEQSRLAAQNRELRVELKGRHRIIGDSVPMKALRQQLELAAPTHGRVLIYGESGTGKELVAHALHNLSHLSKSIARRFPKSSSKANSSGTLKGHSQALWRTRSASSNRPMAAPCSWTKWAT